MKEQIHTIPLNDAFLSGDECPFCYLRRQAEQSTVRYVIGPGATYMEVDVREETARTGFCTHHTKALYDYGNTLGNALILQSYYQRMQALVEELTEDCAAPRRSLLRRNRQAEPSRWGQLRERTGQCFICQRVDYHMDRYFETFFLMIKDPEFRRRVEQSKGFCLEHFGELMERAENTLPHAQREWFYSRIPVLMRENLSRVREDLDWLIAKYDHRNAGADWKNSRDALPRAMEKMQSLHPTDPPYRET